MDRRNEVCITKTHIYDLPDECLLDIMRHLSASFHGNLPIRRRPHQDLTVLHPLQCALVCKQWRALADDAVCSIQLSHSNRENVQHLSSRFKHLAELTLSDFQNWPRQRLLALASDTANLRHLNLRAPQLGCFSVSAITEALSRWTGLKRLDLGHYLLWRSAKDVDAMLDALCDLPSLNHLSFSFELNLPTVFARVDAMTGLVTLQLDCPSVPPGSLCHLPRVLRGLMLRKFEGTELPDSLALFTRLESFSLEWALKLTALPESLGRLSLLTKLEVVKCPRLVTVPGTLGNLTRLKVLRVKNSQPRPAWPEGLLSRLTRLEHLRLKRLSERLPDAVGSMHNLRKLELSNGIQISELPVGIGRLRNLQSLRLSHFCSLMGLPESLGGLMALKELEIRNCAQLEGLPESLRDLTQLEECRIERLPCLSCLPEGVSEWRSLTRLDVSMCFSLRALPEGLGDLGLLKELAIDWCSSLVSLPCSMGALTSLQVLRITSCESLVGLPETIEGLTGLRLLELLHCDALGPLPESLRTRTGLRIERFPS